MKINFIEFLDSIKESMENSSKLIFDKKEDLQWSGHFFIENDTYEFLIKKIEFENIKYSDSIYYINFNLLIDDKKIYSIKNKENYSTSDTKKSLNVFATIKKLTMYFLNEIKPNCLFFYGSDKSESRKYMYNEFCHYIEKNYKEYDYMSYDKFDYPLFIIYKYGFNLNLLSKDIIKFLQIKRENENI